MAKRDNFYRRDPMAALNGMIGMSLEERAVYNVVLDLLYATWRPVEDNRQFIARWCECAVQKVNPIIDRLIAKGKLQRFEEGGFWYLTNPRFDDERSAVKGAGGGRKSSGPKAEVGEKSGEVGEKSGEVGEKSAGVRENVPLLEHETTENQSVTPLEKRREEKSRVEAAQAPDPPAGRRRGERIKPDWRPSADDVAFAVREGFTEREVGGIGERFRDYWTAAPGNSAVKLDWSATWRNWVRREAERRGVHGASPRPKQVDWC
ncbi:DUF1376 domain-containing protein [Phenylobacterium sp.]|uniref:DUF1376 domain-containing protein n=1 Tax=Phenylobacterium sp. TaxID=1871053 RepID=UPI0039578A5E